VGAVVVVAAAVVVVVTGTVVVVVEAVVVVMAARSGDAASTPPPHPPATSAAPSSATLHPLRLAITPQGRTPGRVAIGAARDDERVATTDGVQRDGPSRVVIGAAIAIPLVAIAAVALWQSRGGPDRTTPASAAASTTTSVSSYDIAVEGAFSPLNKALPQLAAAISDWGEGTLDDAGFASRLSELAPTFDGVARAVRSLAPHPTEPLALPLLVDATRLYTIALRVHQEAVVETDPLARSQMDLLARRLRVLGDRAFDRSHALTAPPIAVEPELDLRLPAEIPEWRSLGLAAGPPLTAPPGGDELTPLIRVTDRPSQPRSAWDAAVDALDVPPPGAVIGPDAAPADHLGTLADAFVAAADALRDLPVPDGDHEMADRLGLGWLILADVARAGQLAQITGNDAMARIALDLHLVRGAELS
jgi:hypothetical protein